MAIDLLGEREGDAELGADPRSTDRSAANARRGRGAREWCAIGAAAVTLSLALVTGCAPTSDAQAGRTGVAGRDGAESANVLEPHVERHLGPYANVPDGATRKVGADWFERKDGQWVEMTDGSGNL